jgi:hypothetical protein
MRRTSTKTFGEHGARSGKERGARSGKTAHAGRGLLAPQAIRAEKSYVQIAPDAFTRDARAGER